MEINARNVANRLPNITDYDILLLKVFDMVVKNGGFAAAEVCLNKSKSAISVYISSLEARLGQKLCRRGRSGFSLTPEGAKIYEICKDLFADLDRFRERMSEATSQTKGALFLSIDDGLLGRQEAIADALALFKNACSDVFLEVYTTSTERVRQMLIDRTADIGICAEVSEIPGTTVYSLFDEEFVLYCGQGHPLFAKRPEEITPEILAECEFVDSDFNHLADPGSAQESMMLTARSGQASARLLLILSGKMCGVLPQEFAAKWVACGRLRAIQIDGTDLTKTYYAVVRNEIAGSRILQELIEDLRSTLGPASLDHGVPIVPAVLMNDLAQVGTANVMADGAITRH
jgi:LysR family transcriptional regulator, transcriptional activator for bauABCD operon